MAALYGEFFIAAIIMELTPGPNMTWLALLSAREGRWAGLNAVAGITAGLSLLAIVAASGAAVLITAQPVVYEGLRWGGVAFLLFLAYEAWVGEKEATADGDQGRNFRRGFIVNLLNPKAAAVFIIMVPGFAGQEPGKQGTTLILTLIYLAMATTVHSLIVTFAGAFQRALAKPQQELIIRRLFAIALAGIAIWFALTSGRAPS